MATGGSSDGKASEQTARRVGIADYAVTTTGADLRSSGLGSCLGIALFDDTAGVAGLAHIKRPSADEDEQRADMLFADAGTERLVEAMEAEGASRSRIVAKLAGGSTMLNFSSGSLGDRNVEQARATLSNLEIPIVAEDVGGDYGRSLRLDGHTGELTVSSQADDTLVI